MTPTMLSTDVTYRIAMDRQANLRHEVAQARAAQIDDRRTAERLPLTHGPLATLRRRLAGTVSFA